MPAIVSEKNVLDGQITVKQAQVTENGKTFERYKVVREDASVVLLHNPETDTVILTRQFRYPIAHSSAEHILEIVAGKIDTNELPSTAAFRETAEETGYRIQPQNLQFLAACYSTPGYSTEKYFVFAATVTEQDRISEGGGKKGENESIEIVEMDRKTFLQQVKEGHIHDAKTCLAALLYAAEK